MNVLRALCFALSIALLFGVSTSGSCQASYCSEDCDPCLTQCVCTNVCHHSSATFRATHALVDFTYSEVHDGARTVRTFADVVGLSTRATGVPAMPESADLARFARGVLEVSAARFGTTTNAPWVLDAVDVYENVRVVTFHLDSAQISDPAANQMSFLFDAAGNLIEVDQTLSREM